MSGKKDEHRFSDPCLRALDEDYRYFKAYVPSLKLDESDLGEYRLAHNFNNFMGKLSEKIFEGVGHHNGGGAGFSGIDAGFELLTHKKAEKNAHMIDRDSRVGLKISEDITQLRRAVVLAKSHNEQIDYFRVIAANIDEAERLDLSKDQVMKYYRLALDIMPIVMIDEQRELKHEVLTAREEWRKDFEALSHQFSVFEEGGKLDKQEMKITINKIRKNLSKVEGELGGVLKKQLELQIDADITKEDLARISDVMDQFGFEFGKFRKTSLKNQRIMQFHTTQLLVNYEKQQLDLRREETFSHARQAFGAVSLLGQICDDPGLEKAGRIGQEMVSAAQGITQLAAVGLPNIFSLAALGPVSTILTAAFTVVGLFRKRKRSGLEKIMRELRAIRQLLCQMDRKLDRILDTLDSLINMVDDVKNLITKTGHTLDNGIVQNRVTTIILQIQKMQSELFQILKRNLKFIEKKPKELSEYADTLEVWMEKNACSDAFGGTIFFAGAKKEDLHKNIVVGLSSNPIEYTSALLGFILKSLDRQFPEDVDVKSIFNVDVWMMIIGKYVDVVQLLKGLGENRGDMKQLVTMLENQFKFIAYLQRSSSSYKLFYTEYWKAIEKLEILLTRKFEQLKLSKKHRFASTLNGMMYGDELDGAIEEVVTQIDAYSRIIRACGEVSGIGLSLPELMPKLDRLQIMEKTRRWDDVSCDLEEVTDLTCWPSQMRHCFAQLLVDGKQHLFNFVRTKFGVRINMFDADQNNWSDKGEFKFLESDCAADAFNIKAMPARLFGEDVFYVVFSKNDDVRVFTYAPTSEEPWSFVGTLNPSAMSLAINIYEYEGEEKLVVTALKAGKHIDTQVVHHFLCETEGEVNWKSESKIVKSPVDNYKLYPSGCMFNTLVVNVHEKPVLYTFLQSYKGRIPVVFDSSKKQDDAWKIGAVIFGDKHIRIHKQWHQRIIHDYLWRNDEGDRIITTLYHMNQIQLYCYDPEKNEWHHMDNVNFPKNPFSVNGTHPIYQSMYTNCKSAVIKNNNKFYFLNLVRRPDGLKLFAYDFETKETFALPGVEKFTDEKGFGNGEYFCAMGFALYECFPGHEDVIVSMPQKQSIQIMQLKVIAPKFECDKKIQDERLARQQALVLKQLPEKFVENPKDILPLGKVPVKLLALQHEFSKIDKGLQFAGAFVNSIGDSVKGAEGAEGSSCLLM